MARRKVAVWVGGAFALAAGLFFVASHSNFKRSASKAEVASVIPAAGPRTMESLQAPPVEESSWSRTDTNSASILFASLYSRAESGDIVAQRELAGIYERCALYSLSPSMFNETVRGIARDRGAGASAYDEIILRYKATCSAVDGGQMIPTEAYMLWYEQAAKGGDTASRIRLATSNHGTLTDKEFRELARDATNSADPEAIFALGNLLSLAPDSADLGEFSGISKGPYLPLAWGIVACRLGSDCRPFSARMDEMCIAGSVCGSLDFEDGVRFDLVPQGQATILDKNVRDIEALIRRTN